MNNKKQSHLVLSDANGNEILALGERADTQEFGIMELSFRAEDYPTQETPIFIKDNSAFAHRGLPRKKRR